MNQDAAPDRLLGRRLFWSRVALAWEILWPALWPLLGIAGLFIAFALLDLPNLLPGAVHAAILVCFAAGLAGAAWGVWRKFIWPDALAGRRRIERESGLAHRPLAALADQPSAPLDDGSAALWEAHRRRMAAAMRRLRVW